MKNKLFKNSIAAFLLAISLSSCVGNSGGGVESTQPQTAPSIMLKVQSRYESNGQYSPDLFLNVQSGFYKSAKALRDGIDNNDSNTKQSNINAVADFPLWDSQKIYAQPGQKVLFSKQINGITKTGVFTNFWWTQNEEPTFYPDSGKPWSLIQQVESIGAPKPINKIPTWTSSGQYSGGYVVYYLPENKCYKSQWWVQGTIPPKTPPANSWESPWQQITCPPEDQKESIVIDNRSGEIEGLADLPVQGESNTPIESLTPPPLNVPSVPVAVPIKYDPITPSPISLNVESQLPSQGYTLLRKLTKDDWDWLLPLRYGKSNAFGGTYNNTPYTTTPGDIFTLSNFQKAVLEYNSYAKKNNFKQFLNDGTVKQQAEEFAAFMSNVSRETSGSWSTASEPWISNYSIGVNTTKVWKGGLYWIQEVGYSTDDAGVSPFVSYVDKSSEWKPVQGRSYHGRGPIQLSWNYNYGYFSAWLYDNGIYAEKIKTRDALLKNPGLVNSDPVISMLSAIWFWMTPQGPKPSAHDVIYGAVSNVSRKSSELGLPPMVGNNTPPTAPGDTTDQNVLAYRLGTTINIINGGIECNGAALWHYGPPQRASYYNAYAAYLNTQYNVGAILVTDTINIWNDKISTSSSQAKQSATCFNQKSYYGW